MIVSLTHETSYRYSEPVFLEPHTLRLFPRISIAQQILSHQIQILPQPAGISEVLDVEGNRVSLAWFTAKTDTLRVHSTFKIALDFINPFAFLFYPDKAQHLPLSYDPKEGSILSAALAPLGVLEQMKRFSKELLVGAKGETLPFLLSLIKTIHETFAYEFRETGTALAPEETFQMQKGSCRDFAVMAMAVCRYLGMASRFVSGYYLPQEESEPLELHAWFEVYLPGGGWRGFDPTHGVAAYERHIPLASSVLPQATLPVCGTYRGSASALISYSLKWNREGLD